MEPFLLIFLFMGVIAITAVLMGGWIIFTVIRLVLRAVGAIVAPNPRMPSIPQNSSPQLNSSIGVRCANPKCRHMNPGTAQFCRRCGAALPSVQRVATRRVAMW